MAVTRRCRHGCQIAENLNIIRFFRFKMKAKFTVGDASSRKFNVLYKSVVFVAIQCILCDFRSDFV